MSIQLVVCSVKCYFREHLQPQMTEQVLPQLQTFAEHNKIDLGKSNRKETSWSIDLFSEGISLATNLCYQQKYDNPRIFYASLYCNLSLDKPLNTTFEFILNGEKNTWSVASLTALSKAVEFLDKCRKTPMYNHDKLLFDTTEVFAKTLRKSETCGHPIFVNC